MTANDLRHDTPEPDPSTPEERYDKALVEYICGSTTTDLIVHLREQVHALRDMIASLDAEVARLTETVNRLETERGGVRNLGPLKPLLVESDFADLESPDPVAVAVPRSLVDALGRVRPHIGTGDRTIWSNLAHAYDAWKAGQR